MVGLRAASTVSGQIISRTGRYRVFPIVGMGCVTVALLLMSKMDQGTYAAQLRTRRQPGTLLSAGRVVDPAALQGSPALIAALPPEIHDPYVQAYVTTLQSVFLVAVGFAFVGFLVSLALPAGTLGSSGDMGRAADSDGLTGVGQRLGLLASGVAVFYEEVNARLRAARAARERIDALEAEGRLDGTTARHLRLLYDSRISMITSGAERARRDAGDIDRDPAVWAVALELLQFERDELDRQGLAPAVSVIEEIGDDRDRRIAAAEAARAHLDTIMGLSDEQRAPLRSMLESRLANLRELGVVLPPEEGPGTLRLWSAVHDVLASERSALDSLVPELSGATGDRLRRDDGTERDRLDAAGG